MANGRLKLDGRCIGDVLWNPHVPYLESSCAHGVRLMIQEERAPPHVPFIVLQRCPLHPKLLTRKMRRCKRPAAGRGAWIHVFNASLSLVQHDITVSRMPAAQDRSTLKYRRAQIRHNLPTRRGNLHTLRMLLVHHRVNDAIMIQVDFFFSDFKRC